MPRGGMSEVFSSVTLGPNEDVLFSVPANSLSEKWHMEILFEFDLPRGKGLRDPNNGGTPQMVIYYAIWDLPEKVQQQLRNK